mgnify:CR=1 FL=1
MASKRTHPYQKPLQARRRRAVSLDRPIVLVGLMGVGKSSVGRRLARRLRLPVTDADEAIEQAHDLSISEIFARFGEDYFRDGERRVIQRLMDGKPRVIATGGGAFCQDETRDLILNQAISVWIDADIDTLVERVSRRDTRPLLKNRDAREVLTDLANQRNPHYSQADIHVMSDQLPPEKMVDRIVRSVRLHQASRRRTRNIASRTNIDG